MGKTIRLPKPIVHDGQSADCIELREPTALQVLTAEKAGVESPGAHSQRVTDTTLVAEVAKVSVDLVRQMPVSLFREAAQYVNGFSKGAAKQAKPTLDAELVIDVSPRIEQAGRILSQLELREPTTGEVEEAQRKLGATVNAATLRESQIHLVSLVSEMPRFMINALPISKLDQASRYLLGFT